MNNWFKSGSPWIWMTAGSVSVALIAVLGLVALIAWRGLSFFWPADIYEFHFSDTERQTIIGEIYERERIPVTRLSDAGVDISQIDGEFVTRYLVKIGNRELVPLDFTWVLEPNVVRLETPKDLVVLERSRNGNFYGYLHDVLENGESVVTGGADIKVELRKRMERALELRNEAESISKGPIARINYELEQLRLDRRRLELNNSYTEAAEAEIQAQEEALRAEYREVEQTLFAVRAESERDGVIMIDMRGEEVRMSMNMVLDATWSNDMNILQKWGYFFSQIGKFLTEDPRESNTEGGVFPAIFGTVFMVLLMSVIVTPFGVIAAIYLHEYAGKNSITKLIRIAVINLAGVPSIVYGVFGLGFFVYMVGGTLDQIFYPESLPNPTFGTPGVLWSALTLAILTLPVVIVSTEEGLSRIPSAVREGSLALGATKAETIWRIILPMASPAIMTGLILAVARAAGEVAPLMLVGVVKSAPALPVDGNFPFLHLDRKFMHLGFHIYDVGFQSPNVEAARPLVYATSFLLITVIVGLNLTAIGVRNRLREKFRALEH
ncbi:phosphate ABC transporter, permease protein PstA [Aliidiomarina shirensis]|uniref:Phosphate transport system permease protein PstA n=1 Tax=Aliidiomarina shirensis TaxID=1048642 RepID=A0A432WQS4_9GAMM|nr:phosphate ABC transporter permease PstA [Aliidiomarina shirensis]RUO36120.1 phosphate ABC transporter, permease protein PstA [Aliidiomarina shirensis]